MSKNHRIVNCQSLRRLREDLGAAGFGGGWWLEVGAEEEPESPGATCALQEWQLSFPRVPAPVERRDENCRAALGHCPSGSLYCGLSEGAAKAERAGEENMLHGEEPAGVCPKEKAVRGAGDVMGSTHLARFAHSHPLRMSSFPSSELGWCLWNPCSRSSSSCCKSDPGLSEL